MNQPCEKKWTLNCDGSAPTRPRGRHLLAALGLLAACADLPAPRGDDDVNPGAPSGAAHADAIELQRPLHQYTVQLSEGHAVSYRAYADGALIIGEEGRRGRDESVLESAGASAAGPVALFRASHPGEHLPDELQKLQAFMDRIPTQEQDDESLSPGSGRVSDGATDPSRPIAKGISADPASFLNIFGCFFGDDDVFDACVPNWSGNAFASANSRWAIYKLAPFRGGLRFDTSIGGVPRLSLALDEGAFWVQTHAGPIKRHGGKSYPDVVAHRLDIFSSGDLHFSARFHNYQWDSANCAELWAHDNSAGLGEHKTSTSTVLCTSHYGEL